MVALAQLSPASFRGARFLVPTDEMTEGRKNIEHNYPDKGFARYLEDNGGESSNFRITATLHGPRLSSDWAALRAALKRPGPGTLQHPWLGRARVSVMGRYTVKREDRLSGVLEIEIPFGETTSAALPSILSGIPALVSSIASSIFSLLGGEMSSSWQKPMSAVVSAGVAGAYGATAARIAAGAGVTTATAKQIIDKPHAITSSPETMGATFEALFSEQFDQADLSADSLRAAFVAGLNQADVIAAQALLVPPLTALSVQHISLLETLEASVRVASFAGLAWAVCERAQKTAEAVQDDENKLHDAYGSIQERGISADASALLVDIYTAAAEVLSERSLRLPRITQVAAWGVPASVFSYQLYDTTDQTEELLDLNDEANPIWMEGPQNAVTIE